MTAALVTNVGAQGDSGGATTGTIDTTGASLLVLSTSSWKGNAAPTVSDSKGNTWVGLTAQVPATVGDRVQLFYAVNPTVGSAHTFSSLGTTTFASLGVQAFSGAAVASPFDQENGAAPDANGTSLQTGSVTPSENGEVVVSGVNLNIGTNPTINSSFTITDYANIIGGTSYPFAIAYLIQTSAAAVNPTWSWTTSAPATAAIATFKVAVAIAKQRRTLGLRVGSRT